MLSDLIAAHGHQCLSNCHFSAGYVIRNSALQHGRKRHQQFLIIVGADPSSSRRHHRRLFDNSNETNSEGENDLNRIRPKWKKVNIFQNKEQNGSRNSMVGVKENNKNKIPMDEGKCFPMSYIIEAKLNAENALQSVNRKISESFSWAPEQPKTAFFNLKTNTVSTTPRMIYVSQRTLLFTAKFFLSAIFLSIFFKWFMVLARKYNWGWSESRTSKPTRKVRDRSLGGKEITIRESFWPFGNKESNQNSRYIKSKSKSKPFSVRSLYATKSPLDVEFSANEKDLKIEKANNLKNTLAKNPLPDWWQKTDAISVKDFQTGRKEVQFFLNYLLDLQLSGQDFPYQFIYELYSLCKNYGAFPSFSSTNTRDSIYRSAIQMAFLACSNGLFQVVELKSSNACSFLVNFSLLLQLDARKACSMINGAIAAKIRSVFLQAYASVKQNNADDAIQELRFLSNILSVFPLDTHTPEMEMLTYSLSPRLTVNEREELLSMYSASGGNLTEEIVRQALGLNV